MYFFLCLLLRTFDWVNRLDFDDSFFLMLVLSAWSQGKHQLFNLVKFLKSVFILLFFLNYFRRAML